MITAAIGEVTEQGLHLFVGELREDGHPIRAVWTDTAQEHAERYDGYCYPVSVGRTREAVVKALTSRRNELLVRRARATG